MPPNTPHELLEAYCKQVIACHAHQAYISSVYDPHYIMMLEAILNEHYSQKQELEAQILELMGAK